MRAVVAVSVAVLGAAAACSGGGGDTPELHASLQSSTLFQTQRALALTVRLTGEEELRLGTVQLSTPRFEPVSPQRRDVLVRTSDPTVVVPLRYGDPRCGDVEEAPTELVATVDGEEVRVALEENPSDLLAGLQEAECAAAAVREDVDVRLGDRWEQTGPRTVEGRLEVAQRHPGVEAAVDRVEGNAIFTVTAEDAAGLAVSDDRPSAGAALVVEASRCDPHARIEYKRTFILSAWVRVGGDDPVRLDVEAGGAARRALEAVLETCLD